MRSNAKNDKDLQKIAKLGVSILNEAIQDYRRIVADPEFQELEYLREKARNDEINALTHAREEGELIGEQRGAITGMEQMLLSAFKNNFSPSEIEVMQKTAGISDSRLNELREQAKQ